MVENQPKRVVNKSLQSLNISDSIIFEARSISLNSIPRSDAHVHTSWTDGAGSVQDVYDAAVRCKLTTVLFSEHSRKTSVDWFHRFADEVRRLPDSPCKAYVGTEVKIENFEGDIDTNDQINNLCDFVMASVHRFVDPSLKPIPFGDVNPDTAINIEYNLSMAAIENPRVDILGHMFGMSCRKFEQIPSRDQLIEVIKKAKKYDVAIEINSYYHDDPTYILELAQEYDVMISLGSNAHQIEEVGDIVRKIETQNWHD